LDAKRYLALESLSLNPENLETARFLIRHGIVHRFEKEMRKETDTGVVPFSTLREIFHKKPVSELESYLRHMLRCTRFAAHWLKNSYHCKSVDLRYTIPYRFVTDATGTLFFPKVEKSDFYYEAKVWSLDSMGSINAIPGMEQLDPDLLSQALEKDPSLSHWPLFPLPLDSVGLVIEYTKVKMEEEHMNRFAFYYMDIDMLGHHRAAMDKEATAKGRVQTSDASMHINPSSPPTTRVGHSASDPISTSTPVTPGNVSTHSTAWQSVMAEPIKLDDAPRYENPASWPKDLNYPFKLNTDLLSLEEGKKNMLGSWVSWGYTVLRVLSVVFRSPALSRSRDCYLHKWRSVRMVLIPRLHAWQKYPGAISANS
jgi:hypothetical protein